MERPCGDDCPSAQFMDSISRQKRQNARSQLLNEAALNRATSRKQKRQIKSAMETCERIQSFYDELIPETTLQQAELCTGPFERTTESENGNISTQKACAAFLIAQDMVYEVNPVQD